MSKQQNTAADEERTPSAARRQKSRKKFELWARVDMGKNWPCDKPEWYRVGWHWTAQARDQAREHMAHEHELRGWKTRFANESPNETVQRPSAEGAKVALQRLVGQDGGGW